MKPKNTITKICRDCGKEFICRSNGARRCLVCARKRNMALGKERKKARRLEEKAKEDVRRAHDQREVIALSAAAKERGLSYGQYVAMTAEGGR